MMMAVICSKFSPMEIPEVRLTMATTSSTNHVKTYGFLNGQIYRIQGRFQVGLALTLVIFPSGKEPPLS